MRIYTLASFRDQSVNNSRFIIVIYVVPSLWVLNDQTEIQTKSLPSTNDQRESDIEK